MDTIEIIASVPAIVGLVNLIRDRAKVPSDLAPFIALFLGVGFTMAQGLFTGNIYYDLASKGLILGLAASGIYDVAKKPSVSVIGGPTTVVAESPTVVDDTSEEPV